jgi:DnaJ-class molecular chaperone
MSRHEKWIFQSAECMRLNCIELFLIIIIFSLFSYHSHPDKNPAKDAAEKYRQLQRANAILSDAESRKEYNSLRTEGQLLSFFLSYCVNSNLSFSSFRSFLSLFD